MEPTSTQVFVRLQPNVVYRLRQIHNFSDDADVANYLCIPLDDLKALVDGKKTPDTRLIGKIMRSGLGPAEVIQPGWTACGEAA